MDTQSDDFYRIAIGMMALTYREIHGGSLYKSDESLESLLALLAEVSPIKLGLDFHKDEDLLVVVQRAAQQVGDAANLRMTLALQASTLAFVEFCDLVKKEVPSIDIPALIERLALTAARRGGSAG